MKKAIIPKIQRFLAVILIAGLCWLVDFGALGQAFTNIRVEYLLYLVILSVLLIWLSCVKWQLFIRAAGHEVGVLRLMSYYTMSYFFNMFLPSSLGGDMARSVQLGHHLDSYHSAFAATFVERLTGFLAMIMMGVVFVAGGSRTTAGVEGAVLLVAFLSLLGSLVCFSPSLAAVSFRLSKACLRAVLPDKPARAAVDLLEKIDRSFDFVRNDTPLFAKAMVLSLAFHLLAVLNTYVCALAVGWHSADFGGLCVVVPLVLLVSVAPVTPNAVGIQEGAFLFFLQRIGATYEQGLGVALILRAKSVMTAGAGGLLYLLAGKRAPEYSPEPANS